MKNLKLIFKSLINNEACVEGGRHRPWWLSLILFFVSMLISLVAVFTINIQKTGSDFVSSKTYDLDVALMRFAEEVDKNNLSMKVTSIEGGDNYLEVDLNKWNSTFTTQDERNVEYHVYRHINAEGNPDLDVYYIPEIESDTLTKLINNVGVYDNEADPTTPTAWNKRTYSFMLFTKQYIVIYAYQVGNTSYSGYTSGDYKSFEPGFEISSLAAVTYNDYTFKYSDVTSTSYNTYKDLTWKNWKNFFNTAYTYNHNQYTWQNTLLTFGINAVITIFMGLMIFILTRGKTNPFRIYKFMECQFIAAWATLTPSILAMLLGFLMSQFAQIAFAALLGVRVMWLCMKTLKPEYTSAPQQNKPQARTVGSKPIKK